MNKNNLIEEALGSINSHINMSNIIAEGIRKTKTIFTVDEMKALIGITAVYFENHFLGENPLNLFKVLKDSNYDFQNIYQPLNDISIFDYTKFLVGDFEVVDNKVEEETPVKEEQKEIKCGDYVLAHYPTEANYFKVTLLIGREAVIWSRTHGEVLAPLSELQLVEEGDKEEECIAIASTEHMHGETIYGYTEDGENVVTILPVKFDDSLHYLNKKTNEISKDSFDSIIEILSDAFKGKDVVAVEVM